ncbi:uncharacterized protein LOC131942615 [Physella acuta]|uniref:uncharacterized protein LOC131942615 n=1 Tax=Physella acuta TaxID=109671 RepID=UPI0027DB5F86|nr:uncharacterized protein LOC131942615 [Physella acuta]
MFKTENELKNEIRKFCESPSSKRVMIKIHNLAKLKGEGLGYHFDHCDILCFQTSPDNIKSLREFCRVLYLKHDVKIILRGIEVKSILDADYFHFSKTYNCNLGEETPLDITFGFPKDNIKTKACGLIIYHKNRLVKIKRVTNAERLIGVVNIDCLTPTAFKQDFIKDDKYRHTMKLLRRKKKHFIKQGAKLGLV